jgi:hypothetical protein
MKTISLLVLLCFATACTRTVYLTKTVTDSTATTIRYVPRDTLIQLPRDSAAVRMYLECDSAGQVLLRQIETLNGQLIEARAAPIRNNVATVSATVKPAATVPATLTDRITETERRHTEAEVTIREVPRRARWWEKFFFWCGVAAVVIGVVRVVSILKK